MSADAASFSLNLAEGISISVWVVGIVCACLATRYLRSGTSRLLLLLIAVLFPVLGSLAVMARYGALVLGGRRAAPSEGPQHR